MRQFQGCLGIRQIALGLRHRRLKQYRIDLCDNVTRLHLGIKIGEKFLNVPRNLAAHLHVHDRVQRAGGGHRLRDRTARYRRRLKLSSTRPSKSAEHKKRGDQKDDRRDNKVAATRHFASKRAHMFIMTSERPAALHRNLRHHAAQLAHSRDEFQGEFHPLDDGGSALVSRPDRVFQHHLRPVDRIGDWSKWEVVLLVGTHQIIAQLFQAFFFVNVANIPELVRTGKLDSLLVLPIDSQFAVSTKQFGLDSVVNAALGGVVVVVSLTRLGVVPQPVAYSALSGRDRLRRRHPLFHHAEPGRGQLLDRARPGTGLRLFQFPQYRALSRRDFSAPLPFDF